MRWEKSDALLGLARRLAGSSEGLTLEEMAREAGVKRRTAERMRDAIAHLFPQIEEVAEGRSKRFRIPGGLDGFMQAPTADELAELGLAIRQLAATGHDSRAALLRNLDAKIRAALRAPARRRIEPDLEALLSAEALAMQAGPRPLIEPDTLSLVRDALKGCLLLTFRYGATGGARRIDPYGLIFGRVPYLVGPALGMTKPVLWRLDRMAQLATSGPACGPPDTFSLAAYAAQSFGTFQEEQQDVELRFAPEAAEEATRFLFHPTQSTELQADGALVVRFRAGGMLELVHHLFTWGATVDILQPPTLRELAVEQLRNALDRHRTSPA